MSVITRDSQALRMLEKDGLRWTGGCKVGTKTETKIVSHILLFLLLAFVYCLDDNINQLTDIR